MRWIRDIVRIVTGYYVRVVFAWIGLIFTIITLVYWFAAYRARSDTERESCKTAYVGILNLLVVCVVLVAGMILLIVSLVFLGVLFERVGISSGYVCLVVPVILLTIVILVHRLRHR